ncbi:MAG TPA: hypothetical protein VKA27_03690 [Sunxiuqinia sp.]|nr:hypothetical protein [Sunxiuqinia sp.]
MKPRSLLLVFGLLVFLSGCIVYSFYPLYTKDDLFPNDLLVGKWMDGDSSIWEFEFNYQGKERPANRDSTAFILQIKEKGQADFGRPKLLVHVLKLDGTYFLDFYLEEYFDDDNLTLFDLHVMPIHSFARLRLAGDSAQLNWFSPDWLEDGLQHRKIHIRHEKNEDHLLLTAKPRDLQKFVIKYANNEDAFEKGLDFTLKRLK